MNEQIVRDLRIVRDVAAWDVSSGMAISGAKRRMDINHEGGHGRQRFSPVIQEHPNQRDSVRPFDETGMCAEEILHWPHS
jgi:hypothetical protein